MALDRETTSETLFKRWCCQWPVRVQRIEAPDNAKHKRPDYRVYFETQACVVEVTEMAPNTEDLRQQKELDSQNSVLWSAKPGHRLRKQIDHARGKFGRWARSGVPTLLVVHDTTSASPPRNIDPYDAKVAMYGLDAVVFSVPLEPSTEPRVRFRKSGAKAKLTDKHHTSISAVGNLFETQSGVELVVYHNVFARIPFDPACVRKLTRYQYRYVNEQGEFGAWIHAVTGERLT
ncbi:MAG: hypothetical protein RID42_03380 [Alphaproteobacteria bacterium]